MQVLPTEQFVYSICVNKRQKDSNELCLNIRSMCCCFSLSLFSLFVFSFSSTTFCSFIQKESKPTYLHPQNTRIVVICCFLLDFVFFLFFSFFTIINNLLPIQRRSHGRKKTSSNTKTLYINLFAHVYFLFFCFGLCWTSCLSVSFSFFLSFFRKTSKQ